MSGALKQASVEPEMGFNERVEFLSSFSLFEELGAMFGALEALSACMVERNFEKGESILTEGQPGDELFVLTRGQVAMLKQTHDGERYVVAHMSAEQHVCFGEGGLFDGNASSATIQAESDCHCLVLKRSDFLKFSQDWPNWALALTLKVASRVMSRLTKSNSDLMLLHAALVEEIRGQ